jgi:diguanylate cyclase (GGDEF)-like protein/PAS domain S-box-containing protein
MKLNLELLSNIELFLKLFNNLTDLIYLIAVDENGQFNYMFANDPAKRFVGITNEAYGKAIDEFLPKRTADYIKQRYREAIEKRETISYEDEMDIGPTLTYWGSNITPIFDNTNTCTHILVVARNITERKAKEKELQKVKERLELIWDSAADAVFTIDTNADFVSVNKAFTNLLGWSEEELHADKSISIIPSHFKEDIDEVLNKLKQGEVIPYHTVQRETKTGEIIDVLASYSPIFDEGRFIGSVVMYKDITEQNKYYKQLQESEEKYRIIAEHSSDLIKIIDLEGIISYASPSHYKVLGKLPSSYLKQSILEITHPDEREKIKDSIQQIIDGWEPISLEIRGINSEGKWIWFDTIGTPVFDSAGSITKIIFECRDITERKEYEKKLEQMALYDYLTGLPNRVLFTKELKSEMEKITIKNTQTAVMFLDLDDFKKINDTMGHDVGDQLLKQFGKRMKASLRDNDTLARIGGDEFVILLPGLKEEVDAVTIAKNIIHSLQKHWEIDGNKFHTTSSIGIAFYQKGLTQHELLKQADIALYQAKEMGKNNYQIYGKGI